MDKEQEWGVEKILKEIMAEKPTDLAKDKLIILRTWMSTKEDESKKPIPKHIIIKIL